MKLRFLISGLALFACASVASAQDVVTEDLSAIVEETDYEVDFTEEAQPLQLYALAQNADDNELLRLYYSKNYKTPQALMDKAKKMRLIGWIGGGAFVAGGVIAFIMLNLEDGYNDETTWPVGGICVGTGVIWALSFNLYANSLQKKARQLSMYSAPIIEGDIMNVGANKLTAGVSVMGNQYTHTRGLGMSLKLNF